MLKIFSYKALVSTRSCTHWFFFYLIGLTPLHTAAFLGHIRVIYQLQKIGASVDCEDNLGRRPLHYAAMQKNLECAKYLIRCGAYIHVYDAFEESPAYISVLKTKDVSMIKLLLSYRLR